MLIYCVVLWLYCIVIGNYLFISIIILNLKLDLSRLVYRARDNNPIIYKQIQAHYFGYITQVKLLYIICTIAWTIERVLNHGSMPLA